MAGNWRYHSWSNKFPTGITVAWGTPGTGTVQVTQTSNFGCDSTVNFIGGVAIQRTPAPVITGPDSTCQNKQYVYSVPAVAGDTYAWQVTGGTIVGAINTNSITVAWRLPGAATISITQTSSFGCDSSVTRSDIRIQRTPAPVIAGPDSTCQNEAYTFSVPAVAGDTYAWQVTGGTIVGTSTGSSIQVVWGTPGTGNVQVTQTSGFGCDSTVAASVTILRTPMPVITGPDSTCQNKIYTFSVPAVPGDSYLWQVSSGNIIGSSTSNSVQVAWNIPGIATVTLTQTSPLGCDSVVSLNIRILRTPAPVITGPDSTCQNKQYVLYDTSCGWRYLRMAGDWWNNRWCNQYQHHHGSLGTTGNRNGTSNTDIQLWLRQYRELYRWSNDHAHTGTSDYWSVTALVRTNNMCTQHQQ